ncbi:hypothetical protein [Stenotrophomonas maltophilia]|uniref:hypothetical protein n=1 Tax=Stenotrophomonas maltophilia TaxID=40324 RepID=UPI0007EF9F04|nr:hypothetical protein [Stenotrophomonas maltophilia]OBU53749.1 hypothetical protein A9K69_08140 [Stenotrophomonas maltophilia]
MSENQSPDTVHMPAASAEAGEDHASTSQRRQRLGELAQQLANTVERKRSLLAKIDTMRRAKQAAQGDAATARQQWSAKLRDSEGTPTREIQKLRAKERSALSLAEEYEAMEGEIARELPRLELDLAQVADSCISSKHAIAEEVAGNTYEQLLTQAGDSLAVALALFSTAENAGKSFRDASDADELASRFFGRLNMAVRRRLDDDAVTAQVTQLLALPPMDLSGVDMQLVRSPVSRFKMQQNLSAASSS